MIYESITVENKICHTFAIDDKNFIILASRTLDEAKESEITEQALKENAENYTSPFVSSGFTPIFEGNINIGDTVGYKTSHSDGNYTLSYIQWFNKNTTPVTLYEIISVHTNDNEKVFNDIINSIKIKNP